MRSREDARTARRKRTPNSDPHDFQAALSKEQALRLSSPDEKFRERRLALLAMTRSRAEWLEAGEKDPKALDDFLRTMSGYIAYQKELLRLTEAAQARVAAVRIELAKMDKDTPRN